MPNGLYTRWDLVSEKGSFTSQQDETRSFENVVVFYILIMRPECRKKASALQVDRRKVTVSVLMDFVLIATPCSRYGLLLSLLSLSRITSLSH